MYQGQQQFYAGANPQFPLFQIPPPPLTPSNPDDLSNSTSPPEGINDYTAEQAASFGHFEFNQFPGHFPPGPPTPPNQPLNQQQPQYGFKPQEIPSQTQPKSEPAEDNQIPRGQSNSEEDELTPAQSRRKAQNRAAQRAFRERKERHVKELEQQLATLKSAQQETASENERLKLALQKMSTENEILKATRDLQQAAAASNGPGSPDAVVGPMSYSPKDFYSNVLQGHTNKTPSHRIVTSDDGERLLAAGATWDFIISHESYKRGLVDVGDVSDRLKHQARCDGQGPVFSERSILEAIESSVASGSDELL